MLQGQRDLFDLPTGVTYLNCAYMSPQLRAVTEAGRASVARKARPWEISPPDFFADVERLRERFATVVGGDADGVAVIPAVSYGISTAAAQLPVGPGERIVVLEDQFPANVYPWRDLAGRSGAQVTAVARPADGDWTSQVLDAVDDGTRIVAVPGCHWTDGTSVDLSAVAAAVRRVGGALVVDGTQSVGAMPLDVGDLEPDFLVAASYKWLFGPYSLGFMWVHPRHRSGTPIEHGWPQRAGSDDFAGLVDYADDYRDGARRYDVGETANFVLTPMALAALDQVLAWGVDRIAETCGVLTDAVVEAAEGLGLEVVPAAARSPHLIGLTLPAGADPAEVSGRLRDASVHVSVRGTSVRVAPHVYNDLDDVARFADALGRALAS